MKRYLIFKCMYLMILVIIPPDWYEMNVDRDQRYLELASQPLSSPFPLLLNRSMVPAVNCFGSVHLRRQALWYRKRCVPRIVSTIVSDIVFDIVRWHRICTVEFAVWFCPPV